MYYCTMHFGWHLPECPSVIIIAIIREWPSVRFRYSYRLQLGCMMLVIRNRLCKCIIMVCNKRPVEEASS